MVNTMSLFDDNDDSLLEQPVFLRIANRVTTTESSETRGRRDGETASVEREVGHSSCLTLTIDDSDDSCSPIGDRILESNDVSNDCIIVCSPVSNKRELIESDDDNEWSDCHTSSSACSPVKTGLTCSSPMSRAELFLSQLSGRDRRLTDKKAKREALRNAKRAERELKKVNDKANREVLKSKGIKDALKYCTAIIDSQLYAMCAQEVDEIFKSKEANYRLTDSPLIPLSVTWSRRELNLVESVHSSGQSSQSSVSDRHITQNHTLLVMEAKHFVPRVHAFVTKTGVTVFEFVDQIRPLIPNNNLTLIVYKMDEYFRREKSKANNEFRERYKQIGVDSCQPSRRTDRSQLPSVTKSDVDLALIDMNMRLLETNCEFRVSVIKVNNSLDLASEIFRYTRSVAESCGRQERNKQHNMAFCADADNRNTVDPIDDTSFEKLWKRQLMQFPKVSADVADAVVAAYRSPLRLLSAYSSVSEPNALLSDLLVSRRQPNGRVNERKIGAELSHRIYLFMTSTNGSQLLNRV